MYCKPTFGTSCGTRSLNCPDLNGCYDGICADFTIKRHDVYPAFKVSVDDCDGPLDLADLVLEASMWAKAKLKAAILETDTYFALADNIGFEQMMVGDIIVMNRARLPEMMLVEAFDEVNSLVLVQRGYHGTTAQPWKKGAPFRIMKFIGNTAETEMVEQDVIQVDGSTKKNVKTASFLVYHWQPTDTCLPGCYYLEFKLLKMRGSEQLVDGCVQPSIIVPSFTDVNQDFGCTAGDGVEWVRRFPSATEGFTIQVIDSPTKEL